MIKSRAKQERIDAMINHLDAADNFLCAATLSNVLTKRGDEWAMHLVAQVRSFRRMLEQEAAGRKTGDFREVDE